MRFKQCLILIIISLSLVSCMPEKQIEKLGVITSRGTDVIEDDHIETTLMIYQFTKPNGIVVRPVTGKGETIKGALENASLESNFELVPGKIQLELYGIDLAKKGLYPYLDTLNRDARLPDSMYLAIGEPSARDILTINENDISNNVGEHLHGLIDENAADHIIPRITLQKFLGKYFDIGIDPTLPVIEVKNNIPRIKSIAILRDDQYVGELDAKLLLFFQILEETVKNKKFELQLPLTPFEPYIKNYKKTPEKEEHLYTALGLVKSKVLKSLADKENKVFQVDLSLELNLLEVSEPIDLSKDKTLRLLEKEISKEVEKVGKDVINKLQEMNADPFGFGKIYHMYDKDSQLTDEKWREIYPTIEVKFNITTTITRHGSVD